MNIFLMLLAFMFMGGYYYFSSPSSFSKSNSKEELIKISPIKNLIACITENHQYATNDDEKNFRPNNHIFSNENQCNKKYKITTKKICILNNKITDNCYPTNNNETATHYIITYSNFLKNNETAKLLEILKSSTKQNINLGILISKNNSDLIINSHNQNTHLPSGLAKYLKLNSGDIINYTEISNEEITSSIRNQTKPTCINGKISIYRFGIWDCINPTTANVCLGDTIYDETSNSCSPDENKKPHCKIGYSAKFINELNVWQCDIDTSIPTCSSDSKLSFNFETFTWECIYDSFNTQDLSKCESFSTTEFFNNTTTNITSTNQPLVISHQITAQRLSCSKCEIPTNSICVNNNSAFCMPDTNKVQNCIQEDCPISKDLQQTVIFNYPPIGQNATTKQKQYWYNLQKAGYSNILPPNPSSYAPLQPLNHFICLHCAPFDVDWEYSNPPYYGRCKKEGTHSSICDKTHNTYYSILVPDNETSTNTTSTITSGYKCISIDEKPEVLPPCPLGYSRTNNTTTKLKCMPNWCQNSGMKITDITCPSSKPVMVVKGNDDNNCTYCWKPSFLIPELENIEQIPQPASTYTKKTLNPKFSNNLNYLTSTFPNINEIIPIIPALSPKYQNINLFGERTFDESAFNSSGEYQLLLEWIRKDNNNFPIPIPENLLKKVYTYQNQSFIPCPTMTNNFCTDYDQHVFSKPGFSRMWIIPNDNGDWTNSWWSITDENSNTEENTQNIGNIKFYGSFSNTGDLNVSHYYTRDFPWAKNTLSVKSPINTNQTISINNTYNQSTINYDLGSLFPYYGCGSNYLSNGETTHITCSDNCFDILIQNTNSNFREMSSSERNSIFNPANLLNFSTNSTNPYFEIDTASNDDYEILKGNNKSIYLRKSKCENLSDSTTIGCPPYMIRYWLEDENHWSQCVYKMCNNSENSMSDLDLANNLSNGKMQGFIYYKDETNNCVKMAQPSTIDGDDNTLKFISRQGTAYERLVNFNSTFTDYTSLTYYQKSQNCPYGSYYFWNNDYGWIGCVYNFMKDEESNFNNDILWGNYSPTSAGTKKRINTNESGSIWDPTSESFNSYISRRGFNNIKNLNKIVMLTENFTNANNNQSIPAFYLWNPPAWVSIEDKKSETNNSTNFFNSKNTTENNTTFVSILNTEEICANIGTFNKSGTTLYSFLNNSPDFTTNNNKIEYLNNMAPNNERSLSANDLKNIQNHFLTPEHIVITAEKILLLKNSHNNSALFGSNRLFYSDLQKYIEEKPTILKKLSNFYSDNDLLNNPISDYGCYAGRYVSFNSSSFTWDTTCNKIEFCNNNTPNTSNTGYIALIRSYTTDNNITQTCIDLTIPEPSIYDSISNYNANFGVSTTNDYCNQLYGSNNSTTSSILTSLSSYNNNGDITDCINTEVINCSNYSCPNNCFDDTLCKQCCQTQHHNSIELFNNIPGVYRFLQNINGVMKWSSPIINWCNDSNYEENTHAGYIATYFTSNTDPFENNTWRTTNLIQTANVPISNLYDNSTSTSLPCLHLWQPNNTNTNIYTTCMENSTWETTKCIIHSALNISSSTLNSANYTCNDTTCNFSKSNIFKAKLPSNTNLLNIPLNNNTLTYINDISNPAFVHRFNDIKNQSWNNKADPIFCNDLINIANNPTIINSTNWAITNSIKNSNTANISPFTNNESRINNNECIMSTSGNSISSPENIPNLCWNFQNIHSSKPYVYFAQQNNCITLGWSNIELQNYSHAKLSNNQTYFNSNTNSITLPTCGTNVNCDLQNH